MSMTETDPAHLREIWARVFNHVRAELDVATVWLAMQQTVPVTVDGPYFVAGLPEESMYLATNLEGADATAAIEAGLLAVTGRILAFRLIEGTTALHWQAQMPSGIKQEAPPAPNNGGAGQVPTPPLSGAGGSFAPPLSGGAEVPPPNFGGPGGPSSPAAARDVARTWDKLTENLAHGYKAAAFTKYAPGQARYILEAAQMISDTMDVLLPQGGDVPDEQGERMLMKVLERFGAIIQLDPLFIQLEVLRLRARQGR